MRSNTGETHFDRASWLTLAAVLAFVILALGTTLAILRLPTDGWQILYNEKPPPPLAYFAGSWPTPLRAGDRVLTVDGARVAGREAVIPLPSAAWQAGRSVTYTVLRGGQRLEIPVTLHRLDLAGILRSLWFTARDTAAEWSWSLIAILVFFLRPRSPAARLILVAFVSNNVVTKLVWAATTISQNYAPAPLFYTHLTITVFWGYLFFPAIILLALSFPLRIFPLNRWPRAVPALLFGASLVLSLTAAVIPSEPLASAILITDAALLILAFGAALLNARNMSHNPVARAQALWVIFGFALCVIPILVSYLLATYNLLDAASLNWFYNYFTILIWPVCLAIAITRYHLFDVYVIIRRTLQYSLLTILLALVYFGSVVLLQSLFNGFSYAGASGANGSTQDFAIVLSTLAIAALFTPLRRRVQNFIDRRFFRRKYNADQILARFAATARSEVAIEPLTSALLNGVVETMQPEQTSLWLKR